MSSVALLRAWAVPAAVCGVIIAVVLLVEPTVGGLVGFAGMAYLATSLLIIIGVIMLRRTTGPRVRPSVAVLTAAWTAAWVSGVATFGLVDLLLAALDDDPGVGHEGFVISPVFWLLSFPLYVVFLVSALRTAQR